ncbi:MAG: phosphoglucosamine mutase [Phaeodactylibacter sp.]|uniref:phosphoglucosamine mutase n=1 Tax=Phaeodactylibacter sp. TaxID=1940289 RepID=UPI0032EFC447
MALIKSISGIRGTIGGKAGENLTPQDIVESTAAFGQWLLQNGANPKVVIGRDGRISGAVVNALASATLRAMGIDVVDLGLSTTPTVEMAVTMENAGAGIVITASHNPREWNALKFLNSKGEFISKADGEALLKIIDSGDIEYAGVNEIGKVLHDGRYIKKHVQAILDLPYVDVELVKSRKFRVVVDCINSSGSVAMPPLLKALGCEVELLNKKPNGRFAHNPEPLPKHLKGLSREVVEVKAHLGIAVDPDVDRLAFVCEDGSMFGEEYTLVAVADYILQQKPGNTVSNLSSTRALRDITERHGGQYFASAVGEVNVVTEMKNQNAVIGGEGNGGVIVPELHYGRDAMAGAAIFLTYLAKTGQKASALRASYPEYHMVKDRIELTPEIDVDKLLKDLENQFKAEDYHTIDGLKIDFAEGWVHLRKSNTEPIIRVYAEGKSPDAAQAFADRMKSAALELIGG